MKLPRQNSILQAVRARAALLSFAVVAALAIVGSVACARQPDHPLRAESAAPVSTDSMQRVGAVEGFTIIVADLDRSIEFYTKVLTFTLADQAEHSGPEIERFTGVFGSRVLSASLTLGDERIELQQFLAPEGRPIPSDARSNDRSFQHVAIVVSDINAAYAILRSHKVRHASSGPQTLPQTIPAAAGISAFYFKDPDGHALEIIHFPPGKGDPRWHVAARSGAIFLGIDHSAIVVRDTDASLRLYRDVLGFSVVGESENAGVEQEHLNNVFGARLRITTLRTAHGPGVELLEYLAPNDGRPAPPDTKLNDLWAWRTILRCDQASSVIAPGRVRRALHSAGATLVSASVAETPFGPAVAIRDADGHILVLKEPVGAPRRADQPSSRSNSSR